MIPYFQYGCVEITVRKPGDSISNTPVFQEVFHNNYQTPALHIKDPLDSSNNVGRPAHNIPQIKHTFSRAYAVLTSKCDCCEHRLGPNSICEQLLRRMFRYG
eukprot:Filipodium_phascolosomae@DN7412_c0_g1_i1.p1